MGREGKNTLVSKTFATVKNFPRISAITTAGIVVDQLRFLFSVMVGKGREV